MAERFRLATLLRVLEDRRDALREELAQADRALEILAEQIQGLDQSSVEVFDQIREASRGSVDVDLLRAARRNSFAIKRQRLELVSQVEIVKEERERRRVTLMEADREVKKFERMREQWQDRVREAENKRDQSRMDEVSLIGFHRSRVEETET